MEIIFYSPNYVCITAYAREASLLEVQDESHGVGRCGEEICTMVGTNIIGAKWQTKLSYM